MDYKRGGVDPVFADTSFGAATGGFGASAFGTTNNTGGLFGATQNKPGLPHLIPQYPPSPGEYRICFCLTFCTTGAIAAFL